MGVWPRRSASSQLPLVRRLITKRKRGHHHDETEHQPGKPDDALIEAGAHPAAWGFSSAINPKAVRGPVSTTTPELMPLNNYGTAHEADVGDIKTAFPVGFELASSDLLEWHCLAGERRLVQEEILSRELTGDRRRLSPAESRTLTPPYKLLDRHVDVVMCSWSLFAGGM